MKINIEKLLQDPQLAEAERAILQQKMQLENVVHSLYRQLFRDAFADCKQIRWIGLDVEVLGQGQGYNVWLLVNGDPIADHWLWANTNEELYAEPPGSITHTTLALDKAFDALGRSDVLAQFYHRSAKRYLSDEIAQSITVIKHTYQADGLEVDTKVEFDQVLFGRLSRKVRPR